MVQFLLAIAIFVIFTSLYMLWKTKIQAKNSSKVVINLPPEIPGAYFPIGHLYLFISKTPLALILANLADKYGHIFSIRLGIHRAIIVSNWEIVKECFTTNDKVLAGRPASSAGIYLGYNNAAFGFADYGPYWRNIRKLVLLEVLSRRIKSMKKLSEEMDKIVTSWIDEHLMKRELAIKDDDQDFIDVMLSKIDEQFMYGYTRETIIKATILNFEFIPFGSGRRSCPGITFAMQVTHLTLARLLQGFNFSTLGDLPVDLTVGNSITLPKANPLEVFVMPRLAPMLYRH
ncbi:hypothetical protein MTR67_029504 [Solanum verrucosum]|uniref:Cytochrome P450 n=1 Tax=Solanum verrucosum TaxID=315347 RepID=A0AAF0R4E7_SOLVR|nr:hypothetical protein MTR67_029504 [Solanum verrucosum]